ncbi:hypothetical protein MPC1_13470002 [Methylocella tundrae]|nr:hypothetical protein MPC1_13470002 [Methylocella tundrae]
MNIFDDGEFERLLVVGFHHDDRRLVQARPLRRSPAPLPGYDFIGVDESWRRAREDWLDNALLLDRGCEIVELGLIKTLAWIAWIGAKKFDRNLLLSAGAGVGLILAVADEGGKAAPETGPEFVSRFGRFHHLRS